MTSKIEEVLAIYNPCLRDLIVLTTPSKIGLERNLDMDNVIGEGVIADRFSDYSLQSDFIIYAGCTHDARVVSEAEILAEEQNLKESLALQNGATFVYFSTYKVSVATENATDAEYIKHKIQMEKLVESRASKYFIFRLPEIIAFSDSSFLANTINSTLNEQQIEVSKSSYYNLIDIDDVYDIVNFELRSGVRLNQVVNVINPVNSSFADIIRSIELVFDKTVIVKESHTVTSLELDNSDILKTTENAGLYFGPDYLENSIRKHFGHILSKPKLLSIVVPTYNEEHGIDEFYRRTKIVLEKLKPRFDHEIIFVNDYSTDNTAFRLQLLAQGDPSVRVINFSRNFGNQIAITAGIDNSKGDIATIIDDDLQDPPEIIINFISAWQRGNKVVYGVRPKRRNLGFLFKTVAKIYYRVVNKMSDIHIPNDTGDFRLIDKTVITALRNMKEENRYYRGMVAWVGFQQIGVEYERDKRYAGVSTFSFKKYMQFALNGLTSFSDKPLYFSNIAGAFITLVSFVATVLLVFARIFDPNFSIPGWTSLAVIILFFGGIQLLSMGILGIYISKIYREVKRRPLYLVESYINIDSDEKD